MTRAFALMSVFLLLCFSTAAAGDVVVLKDGTIHRGDIIYKDAQILIIKPTTGDVLKVQRENVIWITQAPDSPPEEKAAAQEPPALSLDEGAARLTDDLKTRLEASGDAAVAVAPFWGPGQTVVPLDDTLAERIALGLRAANHRVIEPATVEKVLDALQAGRPSLQNALLAGRLADILGADAAVVGRIAAVSPDAVTVKATLIEATTGMALGESTVVIAKDAEVSKLLNEEPRPEAAPPGSTTLQSAISSSFAASFSLERFYHKYVANKPGAKLKGDRALWILESGNKAVATRDGQVTVTSTRKLTEQGQAKSLQNDLAGVFLNLSTMVDGYAAGELHKDVEFDSVYYAHEPGVLHRFIIRERTDLTRRHWRLNKNGNAISYAKIALVIDGSWAKLSLGHVYVVSFGRWTTRSSDSGINGDEDSVRIQIAPYGWIRWYVGLIDLVTEPTLNPPMITGWGSVVVEYRTNELVEHLQLAAGPASPDSTQRAPRERPGPRHTFNFP